MQDLLDSMQYRWDWQYFNHEAITEAWDEYCWITRVHLEEDGQ